MLKQLMERIDWTKIPEISRIFDDFSYKGIKTKLSSKKINFKKEKHVINNIEPSLLSSILTIYATQNQELNYRENETIDTIIPHNLLNEYSETDFIFENEPSSFREYSQITTINKDLFRKNKINLEKNIIREETPVAKPNSEFWYFSPGTSINSYSLEGFDSGLLEKTILYSVLNSTFGDISFGTLSATELEIYSAKKRIGAIVSDLSTGIISYQGLIRPNENLVLSLSKSDITRGLRGNYTEFHDVFQMVRLNHFLNSIENFATEVAKNRIETSYMKLGEKIHPSAILNFEYLSATMLLLNDAKRFEELVLAIPEISNEQVLRTTYTSFRSLNEFGNQELTDEFSRFLVKGFKKNVFFKPSSIIYEDEMYDSIGDYDLHNFKKKRIEYINNERINNDFINKKYLTKEIDKDYKYGNYKYNSYVTDEVFGYDLLSFITDISAMSVRYERFEQGSGIKFIKIVEQYLDKKDYVFDLVTTLKSRETEKGLRESLSLVDYLSDSEVLDIVLNVQPLYNTDVLHTLIGLKDLPKEQRKKLFGIITESNKSSSFLAAYELAAAKNIIDGIQELNLDDYLDFVGSEEYSKRKQAFAKASKKHFDTRTHIEALTNFTLSMLINDDTTFINEALDALANYEADNQKNLLNLFNNQKTQKRRRKLNGLIKENSVVRNISLQKSKVPAVYTMLTQHEQIGADLIIGISDAMSKIYSAGFQILYDQISRKNSDLQKGRYKISNLKGYYSLIGNEGFLESLDLIRSSDLFENQVKSEKFLDTFYAFSKILGVDSTIETIGILANYDAHSHYTLINLIAAGTEIKRDKRHGLESLVTFLKETTVIDAVNEKLKDVDGKVNISSLSYIYTALWDNELVLESITVANQIFNSVNGESLFYSNLIDIHELKESGGNIKIKTRTYLEFIRSEKFLETLQEIEKSKKGFFHNTNSSNSNALIGTAKTLLLESNELAENYLQLSIQYAKTSVAQRSVANAINSLISKDKEKITGFMTLLSDNYILDSLNKFSTGDLVSSLSEVYRQLDASYAKLSLYGIMGFHDEKDSSLYSLIESDFKKISDRNSKDLLEGFIQLMLNPHFKQVYSELTMQLQERSRMEVLCNLSTLMKSEKAKVAQKVMETVAVTKNKAFKNELIRHGLTKGVHNYLVFELFGEDIFVGKDSRLQNKFSRVLHAASEKDSNVEFITGLRKLTFANIDDKLDYAYTGLYLLNKQNEEFKEFQTRDVDGLAEHLNSILASRVGYDGQNKLAFHSKTSFIRFATDLKKRGSVDIDYLLGMHFKYGSTEEFYNSEKNTLRTIRLLKKNGYDTGFVAASGIEINSRESEGHEITWQEEFRQVVRSLIGSKDSPPAHHIPDMKPRVIFPYIMDYYNKAVEGDEACAKFIIDYFIERISNAQQKKQDSKLQKALYMLSSVRDDIGKESIRYGGKMTAVVSQKNIPDILYDNDFLRCCIFYPSGASKEESPLIAMDPKTPLIEFWIEGIDQAAAIATMYCGLNNNMFMDTMESNEEIYSVLGVNPTKKFYLDSMVAMTDKAMINGNMPKKLVIYASPHGKPIEFVNYVKELANRPDIKAKGIITYDAAYEFEAVDSNDTALICSSSNKHHYTDAFGTNKKIMGKINVYVIDVETYMKELM